MRDNPVKPIREEGPLKMDGFDEAIIGLTDGASNGGLLVYDQEKIIKILMERDGMTEDDAYEYYSFNIAGAGSRIDGITPGIKVAGQPFDTATLATGIPAFKADNQRNAAPIKLKLE